jgi:hypothetical protein
MSNFFVMASVGCELSVDDFSRMRDHFRERGDVAMAGLAQAIVERLAQIAANAEAHTHAQISEDCGRSSRGAAQMADRFNELDEDKMADLAETVALRLERIACDAMSETQPIDVPLKPPRNDPNEEPTDG